jgi:hypothetical protein
MSELYAEIVTVFSAWKRLCRMRQSKEKWSEADFAANVYALFNHPLYSPSTLGICLGTMCFVALLFGRVRIGKELVFSSLQL